jgi:hypothetical protein
MRCSCLVKVVATCTVLTVPGGYGCSTSSSLPAPPSSNEAAGGSNSATGGTSMTTTSGDLGGTTGGTMSATGGAPACPTNQRCSGVCVDLSNDPLNCGNCATACTSTQICSGGQCVCPPENPDACGPRCVNLQTATTDCGTCYNTCSPKRCISGQCACGATDITCGTDGACYDPMTDLKHCGDCNTACGQYDKCIQGQCALSCSAFPGTGGAPLQDCGNGVCIDTMKDVDNCGGCGNVCPNHSMFTCLNGSCVCGAQGATRCGDLCVDATSDPRFCGDCSTACVAGHNCVNGQCTCSDTSISCAGNCYDPKTDKNHCGGCNTQCGLFDECIDGQCVLSCSAYNDTAGYAFADCSGVCKDIAYDATNCGACGKACGAGQVCAAGKCSCDTGSDLCSGICYNLQTNAAHCGSCTTSCSAAQSCVGGACQCADGLTACGQLCVNTQVDPANCGKCSVACTAKQMCQGGTCKTSVISVQSESVADTTQQGQLLFYLKVCNASGAQLSLAGIALKYWYTIDGATATQETAVYYDGGLSPAPNVTAAELPDFRVKADAAMTVTFGANTLATGACTNALQLGIHATGFTCCYAAQSGDWSYLASPSAFVENAAITAYDSKGVLIWGLEPGVVQ